MINNKSISISQFCFTFLSWNWHKLFNQDKTHSWMNLALYFHVKLDANYLTGTRLTRGWWRSHAVLTLLSALRAGWASLMMIMMGTASASVLIVATVLAAGFQMLRCLERFPMHPYRSTVNEFLIIFEILLKAACLRWLSW